MSTLWDGPINTPAQHVIQDQVRRILSEVICKTDLWAAARDSCNGAALDDDERNGDEAMDFDPMT